MHSLILISNHLQSWNRSYPISACVWITRPLLPTKYMLPFKPNENKYPQLVKVLTNHLYKLGKLHENKLIVHDLVASN
jgi:hypothetical protein